MDYKYFTISISNMVATVAFNRPDKANALNRDSWREMQEIFESLSINKLVRVIILSGEGNNWCAGIDLELLLSMNNLDLSQGEARKREEVRSFIKFMQTSISSIENCHKPVLAAIHNGCIGGGVDIATACDIRYCTSDAYFTIKEIELGLVADLGTLQRLPKIINSGQVAEMAFSGRKVFGPEAQDIHLVSKTFKDKETMMTHVNQIASLIAKHSPLAIKGTKEILKYTRDHTVEDSLNYVATYNAAYLSTKDIQEAFTAKLEKRDPDYLG